MANETMTPAERRDEAAIILEGIRETVRMAHDHGDLGHGIGSIVALLERNLEHLDDLVVNIEVASDRVSAGERAKNVEESARYELTPLGRDLREQMANHNDVGKHMTELEEALRIAHGTAIVLSGDNDLDECITGALEGISAQLRRARNAFEAIAKARAS